MAITSVNPATEQEVARFDEHPPDHVDAVLQRASDAQRDWRRLSFESRGSHLAQVARLLREEKTRLAALATEEMGKPLVEAAAEVEKCAWSLDWYTENSAQLLAPKEMSSNATQSYVQYQPLGVLLAVMPWNFPYWQFFRAAAPALMAGNTIVLKHASNVPRCALAIEDLFVRAGVPTGVAAALLVGPAAVAGLIADPRVAAVTLTGSDAAGSKVAEAAGKALKKCVLELGGSDPFIVLDDADLQQAATVACRARNQNNGQSCIAAKRFIVDRKVADEFEELFVAAVKALKVGDPTDPATNVGPLARADLVDDLADQVGRTLAMGGRILTGGKRQAGTGYYFEPTVVGDVTRDMPVFREETFGPVAALIRVDGEEEAVAVANDCDYGLGAAVWTGDPERGKALAGQIEAGMVFVNGLVASDARIPFGGIKRSGYGRELSEFGIKEFMNIQTVWVGPAR
ncbi:MAG: NAD-dependent succinate-semialdehyde dehydrogenase [Candidatus Dormibacteraeota bacterium]|nr:NAD-dependent succinate-semialdehyde dehydrogenase [Candidatus Dormibacteraeota bacterium]